MQKRDPTQNSKPANCLKIANTTPIE